MPLGGNKFDAELVHQTSRVVLANTFRRLRAAVGYWQLVA